MMTIDKKLLRHIAEHEMLRQGDSVLCAVSGGADSVCLLHWLNANAERLGIKVYAAHYEHGIRGAEALEDAVFTEKLCAGLGVECAVGHGNVPEWAQQHGCGTEEAARILRYGFLNEAAQRFGCRVIATAHNADDNAETVLFNLTRGSGAAGLCGIPPVRDNIIRPLLAVQRSEIEAYLSENGVLHVEDSTNALDEYTRNIIRHRVMPVLREINPGLADAVLRESSLLRQDEDFLQQQAQSFLDANCADKSVSIAELKKLHPAVQARVVRRLCPRTLSAVHAEAVLSLLNGTERASVDVPGLRVRRDRGMLIFGGIDELPELEPAVLTEASPVVIPRAGLVICMNSAENPQNSSEINELFKSYLFKTQSLCGTISVTGRQPGDRLRPIGRGCTKTLKQLFAEAGFSEQQRRLTPVIRDEKGILAVVGLAVDERCRVRAGDKAVRIDIYRK